MTRKREDHPPSSLFGYRKGKTNPQLVCQVEGCDSFAATEIKVGMNDDWHALCTYHRRGWSEEMHKSVRWGERRRRGLSAAL